MSNGARALILFHPISASDRTLAEGEGRSEVYQVRFGVCFLPWQSKSVNQTESNKPLNWFAGLFCIDHTVNGTHNGPAGHNAKDWEGRCMASFLVIGQCRWHFWNMMQLATHLQTSLGLVMPGILRSGSLFTMMVLKGCFWDFNTRINSILIKQKRNMKCQSGEWTGWSIPKPQQTKRRKTKDLTWVLRGMPHL